MKDLQTQTGSAWYWTGQILGEPSCQRVLDTLGIGMYSKEQVSMMQRPDSDTSMRLVDDQADNENVPQKSGAISAGRE